MNIGHARACLSPTKKEFYLLGYRDPSRFEPALGIHDDIYANSLLFEQDGKELFLFCADVLEFEEEMAEDVKTLLNKKYQIDRDSIFLCAAHNHSSCASYHKSWFTHKFDPEYYAFFIETIEKSLEECRKNLQPAAARMGSKVILGYYGNRNHPGKPADNEVTVIKFFDSDNQPFAGLVNWAVHSTVLPGSNRYLTAELAGNVSKELEKYFGFYPAMIVGCAGDCSNRNERKGKDFQELERVSQGIAEEIAKIDINKTLDLNEIHIQTLFHTIHHDMDFVHDEARAEIKKLQQQMQENPDKAGYCKNRMKEMEDLLSENHFHLDAKGWVVSLGDLTLYAFPGELGSGFAEDLKAAANHKAIIGGYANGYYEYFMPASEYGLSFETIGCKVPKYEPEKLIEKFTQAARLLEDEKQSG